MQFSGLVFEELAFFVLDEVTGIGDSELPAMLVQRRARWQGKSILNHASAKPGHAPQDALPIVCSVEFPLQKALAEIHINWVANCVLDRLSDTTHVEIVGDLRFVEILGIYGVVIQESTRMVRHTYSLRVSEADPLKLVSDSKPIALMPAKADPLAVVPWRIPVPQWMHGIVRQLLAGHPDAAQAKALASDSTLAKMISNAIEAESLSLVASKDWTADIAGKFFINSLIRRCASLMHRYAPEHNMPRSLQQQEQDGEPHLGDYAYRLICHREVLSKLLREQPNLLQPYLALLTCVEHGRGTEPVQWVQQQLRKLGGTPRVWRCILKSDERLFAPALKQFGHPLLALTWAIALLERCETSGPFSHRFVRAFAPHAVWAMDHRISPYGNIEKYSGVENPQLSARQDPIVLAARSLWRHLNIEFRDRSDLSAAYPSKTQSGQIEILEAWFANNPANGQYLLGKHSWPQLYEKANQAIGASVSTRRNEANWWFSEKDIEQIDGEFYVLPLVNAYELAVQGRLMRNCMRDTRYEEKGSPHMFLCAFPTGSDKAFAMIELVWCDHFWRLVQIAGPANRSIERKRRKRIINAAKHVAAQMRSPTRSTETDLGNQIQLDFLD